MNNSTWLRWKCIFSSTHTLPVIVLNSWLVSVIVTQPLPVVVTRIVPVVVTRTVPVVVIQLVVMACSLGQFALYITSVVFL